MGYLADRHSEALATVETWLAATFPGAVRATRHRLEQVGIGSGYEGWFVPTPTGPTLLVGVDTAFPYSAPRTAFVDHPDLVLAPHVEGTQRLCTLGDGAAVNPDDPIGVVKAYIDASLRLIAENQINPDTADFKIDFEAYWGRSANERAVTVQGLIALRPPSRMIVSWPGANMVFVAETANDASRWLRHRYGAGTKIDLVPAGLAWLDVLPNPSEYPTDVANLRSLLAERAPDSVEVLDRVIRSSSLRRAIVIAGPATDARAAAGALILQNPARRSQFSTGDRIQHGFRPGKVPRTVQQARSHLSRARLLRVDESATRLEPGLFARLQEKRVAIIGCGSLGAGVARLLAQSGLGHLRLIDPDDFRWANLGRHELGADAVGSYKAAALATALQRQLPHLREVSAVTDGWVAHAAGNCTIFDDVDLVCSFTGDWNAESALSDFQRAHELKAPLLFGWLERRAMAAHSLLLNGKGACLRCFFDHLGNARDPLTCWMAEEQNEQCADGASPYGAVELAHAQALSANLVIDVVLGRAVAPLHRVWLGLTTDLERAGGSWSKSLLDKSGDPGRGGSLTALAIARKDGCTCH